MTASPMQSLAEKVWARLTPGAPDECWEWPGYRFPKGYGLVGRNSYVHRVVMGVTDPGVIVRHKCDNPPCCNPAHLEVGTQQENLADMVIRGRSNTGTRHHNARLTPAQIEAIRADPRTSSRVAADFGVSARHVRKIRAGTRWQVVA